jgi:transposase
MNVVKISPEQTPNLQGDSMLQPVDVERILCLYQLGWGSKRISKEIGISRQTVRKYLKAKCWKPPVPRNTRKLAGLELWLKASFKKHRGNADVIRQELITEHGIHASIRTVQRAVQPFRQEAFTKAKATIRFETPPGQQLQIDFGSTKILIGNENVRVYLFVATLGYSRRMFICPFLHERQTAWFKGIEGAFAYFGGIPQEILLDNARALVSLHNPNSGEVIFNERFKTFAQYWGFKPLACAPYRARTKGKDERMVGYVKNNAIAGHTFSHWEDLNNHLQKWNAEIADLRIHNTTEERPLERFLRDEARALHFYSNKPPFIQVREFSRQVHADACIEIDTNYYSVPCKLVGLSVTVQIVDKTIRIFHSGVEVACHCECEGRRNRIVDRNHLKGIVGNFKKRNQNDADVFLHRRKKSELLRPLSEYEAVIGGRW